MKVVNLEMEKLNNDNEYRGYYITEFSKLERVIDLYLATYFIHKENEVHELISILIDRLSYEAKKTALKTLLNKKNEWDVILNSRGNSKKYKEIDALLTKVGKIRNNFAHFHLVQIKHQSKLVIDMIEFRDELKLKGYTHIQFEKLIEDIVNVKNELIGLLMELQNQRRG